MNENENDALRRLEELMYEQLSSEEIEQLSLCVKHNIPITSEIADEPNADGTYTITINYDDESLAKVIAGEYGEHVVCI